jgi:hypothetical protein
LNVQSHWQNSLTCRLWNLHFLHFWKWAFDLFSLFSAFYAKPTYTL